ncbi:(2Fe-2S)-binding protein [Streptomyces sp. CRN 30]|uniref:(2Fe-2S)-binding protein n=1 Tax=Streptomyces sp. CRN 30 TaxID=3075613 RepID=UPI002A834B40|nr:(2Fe-2S)-binding protein [Streptomyces sp. CRN 30]
MDPAPDRAPAPSDRDLAALAALGGFFALRAQGPPPRPLPALAHAYGRGGPRDDDPLTRRVRRVGDALRAPEPRVAASVAHQGLAARLWSVALGSAALYGGVPDLDPSLLRWDPMASAPDDLWLTEVRPLPGDAATVARVVLDGHLAPLAAALRARYRIAEGLLWGNAASALAATARELTRWSRERDRPHTAARTRALAAELLTHPRLTGAATTTPAFRRRSCCLYYRVPGGGLCGDCCFTRPPRPPATAPRGNPPHSSPRAPAG